MTFVTCLNLICPVGYTTASAVSAMRAGIAAHSESEYRDNSGEPITTCSIDALPSDLRGPDRLRHLILLALNELALMETSNPDWREVPLIICAGSEQRPGPNSAKVFEKLEHETSKEFRFKDVSLLASGATSSLQAITAAQTLLANTTVPAVLVLAADSLLDPRTLNWLEQTRRLKTSERTDGIIPGEAACISIVSRQPMGDDHVVVHGIGTATEDATVLNETPFRAEGMTTAVREALIQAGVQMHEVDLRITDAAGESYSFEELTLTQTRLMRKVRASQPIWHPAANIGDCGSASGLIQLAWAGQAFYRGYAPGSLATIHTSSAFGKRAAAVVSPSDRRAR